MPGADTIAVPDFDVDPRGHGCFAQAEALLHDTLDRMCFEAAPGKWQRTTPTTHEGLSPWKLRRSARRSRSATPN